MNLRTCGAIVVSLITVTASLQAQTSPVTLDTVSGYSGWGWTALVMHNGLITLATVPAIGGRVMRYDLGTHPSLFVNSAEFGHTYTPSRTAPWHNFGGFKTWPSPQNRWPNNWPPPPTLDAGSYTFRLDTLSQPGDSASVFVASPSEQWVAPKIRYERTATVYRGSTRVRMEQTMINDSSAAQSWGIWGVSQSIVAHQGQSDYQNFWVYFPLNPQSVFGPTGVGAGPHPQDTSSGWKGEIAPGVYGVQFVPSNALLFGDPARGWIAYADLRDSMVFAKTFRIFDGSQYPDGGARISVYESGAAPPQYFEVEVKGPVVPVAPNGGRYTFTEDWWAGKVRGPVLDVDSVGAISARLSYQSGSHLLTGCYGVFYQGSAQAVVVNAGGDVVGEGKTHSVSPLEEFVLQDTMTFPAGASSVQVRVYNETGGFVGVVDTADVALLISSVGDARPGLASGYALAPGYPNPFNNGTVLTFFCPRSASGSLKIFDLLGKEVAVLETGPFSAGEHRARWSPSHVSSGIYIARLEIAGESRIQKLLYLR